MNQRKAAMRPLGYNLSFANLRFNGLLLLWISIWFPLSKPLMKSTSRSQIFAVFAIFGLVSLILFFSRKRIIICRAAYFYFSIFFIFFILGIYYNSPPARLISDSFRYFLFGVFVVIGYSFYVNEARLLDFLYKIVFLQILFSLLVFLPASYPIIDFFKGRMHNDELFFHFVRFSGTMGYPTEFGCFILLPIVHMIHNRSVFTSRKSILFACICALGVVGSVSRAAILMVGVYLILQLFIALFDILQKQRIKYQNIYFLWLLVIALLLLVFLVQLEHDRFSVAGYMLSIFSKVDSSILHRFNELRLSLDILSANLTVPTGHDRIQPYGIDVVESFFGSTVLRFGWIGFFVYLAFVIFFIYQVACSCNKTVYQSVLIWFLLAYIVVSPFSEIIFRSKGTAIFGLLLGICLRGTRELKRDNTT